MPATVRGCVWGAYRLLVDQGDTDRLPIGDPARERLLSDLESVWQSIPDPGERGGRAEAIAAEYLAPTVGVQGCLL